VASTGELQQLRGIDRAAAEDHLRPGAGLAALAALLIGDADGALALEQDSGRQCTRLDPQIGPALGRPEISAGGREA
jgi:hypothetical protein